MFYADLTCANETISANCLGTSSTFEQEGKFGIRPKNPQQLFTMLYGPTDLAEILRYASVGVNISAGMVAHIGTRFGGSEEFSNAESTSCTVSSDGCIFN